MSKYGEKPPPRTKLLEELAQASRAYSDATVLFHAAIADALDLHATDHKVMSMLERTGPLSAGAIAERTGLVPASVTALIDRLEGRGLVRRESDPDDRRRVMVAVTEEAVARVAPYFQRRRNALARLYARYTDDDLAAIVDFLMHGAALFREDLESSVAEGRTGAG